MLASCVKVVGKLVDQLLRPLAGSTNRSTTSKEGEEKCPRWELLKEREGLKKIRASAQDLGALPPSQDAMLSRGFGSIRNGNRAWLGGPRAQ